MKKIELFKPVTPEVVKRAVLDMSLNRSPGFDGFSATFFNKNWDTVGLDIIKMVQNAYIYLVLSLLNLIVP